MTNIPATRPRVPDEWRDILAHGERILWQGASDNDIPFKKATGPEIVAGIVMMLGIAVVILLALPEANSIFANAFLLLFGLVMTGVTAYVSYGHRILASYRLRHSFYTLTNQRAYSGWLALGRRQLKFWDICSHTIVELDQGNPGSVRFSQMPYDLRYIRNRSRTKKFEFLNIRDARAVYELALQVRQDKA
ncbi:MAG: hypothetical protein L3J36_08790 [Rhodobacteraceae bacterium]|nr:hypothetical protein [Paracoccaceae bacterium]